MDERMEEIKINNNFRLSSVRLDQLKEAEYTVVTILVDITQSVEGFADDLVNMEKNIIKACRKHPKSENLIINNLLFNNIIEIEENHGYKILSMIDEEKDYKTLNCEGCTNLYDAINSALEGLQIEAVRLRKSGYIVNTALYIVTDGDDNRSKLRVKDIKCNISEIRKKEKFKLTSVLIGINSKDDNYKLRLEELQQKGGIERYVECPDASPSTLAKLGGFIAESISSSSMNMPQPQTPTF